MRAIYTSDDGNDYSVRLPSWEANLQSASAATTEPSLPKGYQRRKRYYKITAGGREGTVTVLSVASTLWTNPFGTGVIIPLFGAATPSTANATLEGRTGEKSKHL